MARAWEHKEGIMGCPLGEAMGEQLYRCPKADRCKASCDGQHNIPHYHKELCDEDDADNGCPPCEPLKPQIELPLLTDEQIEKVNEPYACDDIDPKVNCEAQRNADQTLYTQALKERDEANAKTTFWVKHANEQATVIQEQQAEITRLTEKLEHEHHKAQAQSDRADWLEEDNRKLKAGQLTAEEIKFLNLDNEYCFHPETCCQYCNEKLCKSILAKLKGGK